MRVLLSSLIYLCLLQISWGQLTDAQRRSSGRDSVFEVFGDSPELRRPILTLVSELRRDFLLLFMESADRDRSTNSLVVELHEPVAGRRASTVAIRRQLLALGEGYRLQLDVYLDAGLDQEELKRQVLGFLVIEQGLRGEQGLAQGVEFTAPPWIVAGILEAIAWKNDLGDRELYASVLKDNTSLGVEKTLATKDILDLDPISRMEFSVWAGATVMALLDSSKDARTNFPAFLGELSQFDGEMSVLLSKHFPDLNISAKSLKKWVALKIANLSQAKVTDVLTVKETEVRLEEILTYERKVESEAPVRMAIWDVLPHLEEGEREVLVNRRSRELYRLSYRCFPLIRPLLIRYSRLLSGADEVTSQEDELAQLEEIRGRLVSDSERARDVLDWYQLNSSNSVSGRLEDYIRLKDELKKADGDNVRRDSLSRYLDEVNGILGGGSKER